MPALFLLPFWKAVFRLRMSNGLQTAGSGGVLWLILRTGGAGRKEAEACRSRECHALGLTSSL